MFWKAWLLFNLAVVALALSSAHAQQSQSTMILNAQDIQIWSGINGMMDQCVGAMAARGDASACRMVGDYLRAFRERVISSPSIPPPPQLPSDKTQP